MKNAGNVQGQIMALSSMARIYETLANATKAIESLQKVRKILSLCVDYYKSDVQMW